MSNTFTLEFPDDVKNLLKSIDSKLDQIIGTSKDETYYSLKEAATKLGMSYQTIREHAINGNIETIDKGTGKNQFLMISQNALSKFRKERSL